MILLFVESRLRFKNLPFNLILELFNSSINYQYKYIVYRNENSTSCFLGILHVNSEIFDID